MNEELIIKIRDKITESCASRKLDGGGLARYIEHGIGPGGFLTAVLEDSLVEAASRADDQNQRRLFDWAYIMYNDVPWDARGSRENVRAWMAHGGMRGIQGG